MHNTKVYKLKFITKLMVTIVEPRLQRIRKIAENLLTNIESKFPKTAIKNYYPWGVTGWQEWGFRKEGYALLNENGLKLDAVYMNGPETLVKRSNFVITSLKLITMGLSGLVLCSSAARKDYRDKILAICTNWQNKDRIIIPSEDTFLIEKAGEVSNAQNLEIISGWPDY